MSNGVTVGGPVGVMLVTHGVTVGVMLVTHDMA